MDQSGWTYFFVILTFGIYIAIAIWAKAGSTKEFYVAGHDVHPTAVSYTHLTLPTTPYV